MKYIFFVLVLLFQGVSFGKVCSHDFSETVPYKVEKDDWISKIALSAYGHHVYDEEMAECTNIIAEINGIENPDVILPGQIVNIPFGFKEPRVFTLPVSQSKIGKGNKPVKLMVETILPEVASVAFVGKTFNQSNVLSLPAFPQEKMETVISSNVEEKPSEKVAETSVQAVSTETDARQWNKKIGKKNKNSVYHAELPLPLEAGKSIGITEGFFPATFFGPPNEIGIVDIKEDTSVHISLSDQGNMYMIVAQFKTDPTEQTTFAIDINRGHGGTPLSIPGEQLKKFAQVENGKVFKKTQSEEYKTLRNVYKRKPNWLLAKIWRPTRVYLPLGGQVAIALGTGNPVAIAYIGSSLVRGKLENLVTKQKRKEDNPVFLANKIAEQQVELDQFKEQQKMVMQYLLTIGQQLNNQRNVAVNFGGN